MRKLVFSLLLLALSQPLHAQTTVTGARVTEYGIYRGEEVRKVVDTLAASGFQGVITNIVLVEQTTTVPTTLGVRFGYRYTIDGQPAGASATLKKVTRFPPGGLRNPATGTVTFMNQSMITRAIGGSSWTGYTFDEAWEAIPGEWTFELWDGDHKLVSQSFTVVKKN